MNGFARTIMLASALMLGGCALVAPNFDVPTNEAGTPLTLSITRRLRCELASLLFEEVDGHLQKATHSDYLLRNDYKVAVLLNLNVTNKAGLTPQFTFPDTAKYLFSLNTQADLQREDTLSINLSYSMREVASDFGIAPKIFECPEFDTNLSGDLGIRKNATGALATVGLKSERDDDLDPQKGEFSGTIQFLSNLGITGAGPTWTFKHFTGPGPFASANTSNTDKISFAFAKGKGPSKSVSGIARARQLIQEQIQNDSNAQLAGIRNILR